MRIATWNLDHASNGSRPIDLQIEQINNIAPDIVVLTETCEKVDLTQSGYEVALPSNKNKHGKFWTAIWSKYPIINQITTYDPETAVCVEIGTPAGKIIVYGTILTYHGDKGSDGKSPQWFEHHKAIQDHGDDWFRIVRDSGEHLPIFVCGDFNQTRDGSNAYCSRGGESIQLLNAQLLRNNLICLTEGDFGAAGKLAIDPKKGCPRNNTDHICMTKDAFQIDRVDAWDHFTKSGSYTSDHNGVYVDIYREPSCR